MPFKGQLFSRNTYMCLLSEYVRKVKAIKPYILLILLQEELERFSSHSLIISFVLVAKSSLLLTAPRREIRI